MDAAVEMSGMLEANNYNSVTYSVLGNSYLDALASHRYILSRLRSFYCHDLITFSKILIDISKHCRARKVTNHGICAQGTCHTLYYGNIYAESWHLSTIRLHEASTSNLRHRWHLS